MPLPAHQAGSDTLHMKDGTLTPLSCTPTIKQLLPSPNPPQVSWVCKTKQRVCHSSWCAKTLHYKLQYFIQNNLKTLCDILKSHACITATVTMNITEYWFWFYSLSFKRACCISLFYIGLFNMVYWISISFSFFLTELLLKLRLELL